MSIIALIVFAGLVALARLASRDLFAGPSLRYQPHDELGHRYSPVIGQPN